MPENEETEHAEPDVQTVPDSDAENVTEEPSELDLAVARIAELEGQVSAAQETAAEAQAKVTNLQSALYVMQQNSAPAPVEPVDTDEPTITDTDDLFED